MIKNKTMPSSNEVLIEHFDSKFNLLLDGYAMTNKKIDDLKDEMKDRFKAVDDRFDAVDEQFAAIDDKFEAVFDVLDDIKKEVKSVKI